MKSNRRVQGSNPTNRPSRTVRPHRTGIASTEVHQTAASALIPIHAAGLPAFRIRRTAEFAVVPCDAEASRRRAIVRTVRRASAPLAPLEAVQVQCAAFEGLLAAVSAWLAIRPKTSPASAPFRRHLEPLRRECVRMLPALRRMRFLARKSTDPSHFVSSGFTSALKRNPTKQHPQSKEK